MIPGAINRRTRKDGPRLCARPPKLEIGRDFHCSFHVIPFVPGTPVPHANEITIVAEATMETADMMVAQLMFVGVVPHSPR